MILGLEHATVCLTQDKTTNYAQNRASFLIAACSQVDVQFSGGYPRANRKLRAAVLPQYQVVVMKTSLTIDESWPTIRSFLDTRSVQK